MKPTPKGKKQWLKNRWFEFRQGHNTYLSFAVSLTNFILLGFNLLVTKYFGFSNDPLTLVLYTVIMGCFYIPLAIFVGHMHNERQLETDQQISTSKNPIIIELLDGQQEIKKQLEAITKKLEGRG